MVEGHLVTVAVVVAISPLTAVSEMLCHNCGKVGHLAKVCHSNRGGSARSQRPDGAPKSARVANVQSDNDGDSDVLCNIHSIGPNRETLNSGAGT